MKWVVEHVPRNHKNAHRAKFSYNLLSLPYFRLTCCFVSSSPNSTFPAIFRCALPLLYVSCVLILRVMFFARSSLFAITHGNTTNFMSYNGDFSARNSIWISVLGIYCWKTWLELMLCRFGMASVDEETIWGVSPCEWKTDGMWLLAFNEIWRSKFW